MGFVIVIVGALYLLISIGTVAWAVSHARKHGKSLKRWGWGAALVMYLIPFWDWIPTVAVHQYYCATESGFWVYKTLEQWKAENPGVTLVLNNKNSITQKQKDGYTEVHPINQRFNWVVENYYVVPILNLAKKKETLVDSETKNVLSQYVDFSSGYGNFATHNNYGLNGFKFWLTHETCTSGGGNRISFETQLNEVYTFSKGAK